MVNQTVKKMLRSRLPFALNSNDDNNDAASFISSSTRTGASIAPLPPAKPFARRAGGLPDILATTQRGGGRGGGKVREEGGRGGGGIGGGRGEAKTATTSATSGVSAASTEWKTLVKKIHYRNVKKYTQV